MGGRLGRPFRCRLRSVSSPYSSEVGGSVRVLFASAKLVELSKGAGAMTIAKGFTALADPRLEPKAERILDRVQQDSPSPSKPPIRQ